MHIAFRPLAVLLLIGLLSACATAPSKPSEPAEAAAPPAVTQTAPKQLITFVDLDSFDRAMERALSSGASEIEVNFSAPMSPNAIAPRLGKWLNTVQEHGGQINVQNENRTRSLSLLATLADAVYTAWRDLKYKSLVKNIDVDMSVGSNEIKTLTFKRKV